MKRVVSFNSFIAILLLGTVFCSLVESQPGQRSGSSNSSFPKDRGTSARMISGSSPGNKIPVHNDDDDSDSAHDNGPSGRDSSEITFPSDDFYPPPDADPSRPSVRTSGNNGTSDHNRWKKIPLNALVQFGTKDTLAEFFRAYVKNTNVVKDSDTNEEYLTDAEGKPILDPNKKKVFVSVKGNGSEPAGPSLRFNTNINTVSPRGRTSTPLESKAKLHIESADHGAKPLKVSMPLLVCSPEITTVPVPLKVEPNMLIIPKCIKVARCGGCCFSDLTVCEPETTEIAEFSITKLGYDGDNDGNNPRLQLVNSTIVEVERHTKCKCNCKIKKEHCKSHHHRYEANQCSCVCTNTGEFQRCVDGTDNRIWDNETCQCTCKESKVCSSGYRFDLNSCDCEREVELEGRQLRRPFVRQPTKKS